jgi:hypothetical protein
MTAPGGAGPSEPMPYGGAHRTRWSVPAEPAGRLRGVHSAFHRVVLSCAVSIEEAPSTGTGAACG